MSLMLVNQQIATPNHKEVNISRTPVLLAGDEDAALLGADAVGLMQYDVIQM